MGRRKGDKNTYVKPAMELAWQALTEEERQEFKARARSKSRAAVAMLAADRLTAAELREVLAAKEGKT